MKTDKLQELLDELLDDKFRDEAAPEDKKTVGLVLTTEYYEKMKVYYGRNISKIVDEFIKATVEDIEEKLRRTNKKSSAG